MPHEPCSPEVVDQVLGEVFDDTLLKSGFEKIGFRKYVRGRIPHVRDVIQFHSNYINIVFTWGFSLDFVPHVSGRSTENVKWHRTAKSAEPDLRYSEADTAKDTRTKPAISTIRGLQELRDAAISVREVLLPKALTHFDSIKRIQDIEKLFLEKERHPRASFFNLPQVGLGYSFYLARMGRESKARQYISECLKRFDYREETAERLIKLFEDAIQHPLVTQ